MAITSLILAAKINEEDEARTPCTNYCNAVMKTPHTV